MVQRFLLYWEEELEQSVNVSWSRKVSKIRRYFKILSLSPLAKTSILDGVYFLDLTLSLLNLICFDQWFLAWVIQGKVKLSSWLSSWEEQVFANSWFKKDGRHMAQNWIQPLSGREAQLVEPESPKPQWTGKCKWDK